MVVKDGSIKAHPERERGQALLDKPIEVVWLSPNDWQLYEGNVYGCIAFDFNWTQLVEDYGAGRTHQTFSSFGAPARISAR